MDHAHLDRMTILRSREVLGTRTPEASIHGAPRGWSASFWSLPMQAREAWVLARVYGTPEREMARSMDCSTTATARHLERAVDELHATMGAGIDAFVEQIREHTLRADVPAIYHERVAARRRRRRILLMVLALIGVIGMTVLVIILATR